MIALFASVALLGLAAIDPIGLAAMPVLLIQRRPLARSGAFLGGSFVSLMVMGLLFAKGCGVLVLHFETGHAWLVPAVEIAAGTALLAIAGTVFWQLKTGRLAAEPSARLKSRLSLNELHLFLLGAALVAVQSVLDVVFVIAMIRIGQIRLSFPALAAVVATYACAALVLQAAVVAIYAFSPAERRQSILSRVQRALVTYANRAVMGVSLLLGCGLLVLGIFG